MRQLLVVAHADMMVLYIILYSMLHYITFYVPLYSITSYCVVHYFIIDGGIVGMQPRAGVPAVCVFTCGFLDIQSAPPAVEAAAALQSSHEDG